VLATANDALTRTGSAHERGVRDVLRDLTSGYVESRITHKKVANCAPLMPVSAAAGHADILENVPAQVIWCCSFQSLLLVRDTHSALALRVCAHCAQDLVDAPVRLALYNAVVEVFKHKISPVPTQYVLERSALYGEINASECDCANENVHSCSSNAVT